MRRKILFIPLLLLVLFSIVACVKTGNQDHLNAAIEDLYVSATVKNDFELPEADYQDVSVSWVSNNSAIVIDGTQAIVTRGAEDITVKLTATLKSGSFSDSVDFTVVVLSIFDEAIRNVQPTDTVFDSFPLTLSVGDINVSWSSSNNEIVEIEEGSPVALVNVPVLDTAVTLTAVFTKGELTTTRTFEILVVGSESPTGKEEATINFNVTLPQGFPEGQDLYLVGEFSNWETSPQYQLTVNGNEATITVELTIYLDVLEYKFYGTNWELYEGNRLLEAYGAEEYVVNAEIYGFMTEENETFSVKVNFNVELPENTTEGAIVYLAGNFNDFGEYPGWNPGGEEALKLTRDGLTASTYLYLSASVGKTLYYKFTLGNWSYEEVIEWEEYGAGAESNRVYLFSGLVYEIDINIDNITWKGTPPPVGVEYKEVELVFNVEIPANTPEDDDVYLVGTFDSLGLVDWDPAYEQLKLTRNGLNASITLNVEIPETGYTLSYKYTRGDWALVEGDENGDRVDNRDFLLEEDTVFDDVVLSWEDLGPADIEPSDTIEVEVTFNVLLPSNTPEDDDIFIAGNFGPLGLANWNAGDEGAIKLTRNGLTASITLNVEIPEDGYNLQYKYTRGNWDFVEGDENGGQIGNREFLLEDDEVFVDVVLTWEDLGPVVDPEFESFTVHVYFEVEIPENTPEGDSIYLASNVNGWNAGDESRQDFIKLTWDTETLATTSIDVTVTSLNYIFEYKFTRGSWDKVEDLGDPSLNREYVFTEEAISNLELDDQDRLILKLEVIVAEWVDIDDEPEEPVETVEITFVAFLVDYAPEGDLYVIGSWNNWQEAVQLILDEDFYTATINIDASIEDFQYKYKVGDVWEDLGLGVNRYYEVLLEDNEIEDLIFKFDGIDEFETYFVVIVELDEELEIDGDLSIRGNFELFGHDSDVVLLNYLEDEDIYTTSLLLTVKVGDIIEYKVYSEKLEVYEQTQRDYGVWLSIEMLHEIVLLGFEDGEGENPEEPEFESFDIVVTLYFDFDEELEEGEKIYLASNYNEWNSADENYAFTIEDGVATIIFTLTVTEENYDFQYKITRGDWDNTEIIELGEFQDPEAENKDKNRHFLADDAALAEYIDELIVVWPEVIEEEEIEFDLDVPEGFIRVYFVDESNWGDTSWKIHFWGDDIVSSGDWNESPEMIYSENGYFYFDFNLTGESLDDINFIFKQFQGGTAQSADLEFDTENVNIYKLTGWDNGMKLERIYL